MQRAYWPANSLQTDEHSSQDCVLYKPWTLKNKLTSSIRSSIDCIGYGFTPANVNFATKIRLQTLKDYAKQSALMKKPRGTAPRGTAPSQAKSSQGNHSEYHADFQACFCEKGTSQTLKQTVNASK